MRAVSIDVWKPYRYRNTIIYLIDYHYPPLYGHYVTHREAEKIKKFNEIPPASMKDGTFRTVAERRHMKYPRLKYIRLDRKTLAKMSVVKEKL